MEERQDRHDLEATNPHRNDEDGFAGRRKIGVASHGARKTERGSDIAEAGQGGGKSEHEFVAEHHEQDAAGEVSHQKEHHQHEDGPHDVVGNRSAFVAEGQHCTRVQCPTNFAANMLENEHPAHDLWATARGRCTTPDDHRDDQKRSGLVGPEIVVFAGKSGARDEARNLKKSGSNVLECGRALHECDAQKCGDDRGDDQIEDELSVSDEKDGAAGEGAFRSADGGGGQRGQPLEAG